MKMLDFFEAIGTVVIMVIMLTATFGGSLVVGIKVLKAHPILKTVTLPPNVEIIITLLLTLTLAFLFINIIGLLYGTATRHKIH